MQKQQRGDYYMALTLPPNYIAVHRIKIVAHCVPTRNAITRVMLSLGEGQGGVVGWGGKLIFR